MRGQEEEALPRLALWRCSRSARVRFLTFWADQGAVGGAVERDSMLKYLPFASSGGGRSGQLVFLRDVDGSGGYERWR